MMIVEQKPKLFSKEWKKWLYIRLWQEVHKEFKKMEDELFSNWTASPDFKNQTRRIRDKNA